jgi:hypothetical protein
MCNIYGVETNAENYMHVVRDYSYDSVCAFYIILVFLSQATQGWTKMLWNLQQFLAL